MSSFSELENSLIVNCISEELQGPRGPVYINLHGIFQKTEIFINTTMRIKFADVVTIPMLWISMYKLLSNHNKMPNTCMVFQISFSEVTVRGLPVEFL